MRWCEEKDETGYQDWEWVSTPSGGKLRNAVVQKCAGVVDDCLATPVSEDGAVLPSSYANCNSRSSGEFCRGYGDCGESTSLDNCSTYDIYKALRRRWS